MKNEMKIYIVDDDESICKSTQRLLKLMGYGSTYYVNAQQFVESDIIYEDPNVLLILDIRMPKINGLELQEHFHEMSTSVKTILMTAFLEPAVVDRAGNAGVVGLLRKPFTEDDLSEMIQRAIHIFEVEEEEKMKLIKEVNYE